MELYGEILLGVMDVRDRVSSLLCSKEAEFRIGIVDKVSAINAYMEFNTISSSYEVLLDKARNELFNNRADIRDFNELFEVYRRGALKAGASRALKKMLDLYDVTSDIAKVARMQRAVISMEQALLYFKPVETHLSKPGGLDFDSTGALRDLLLQIDALIGIMTGEEKGTFIKKE